MQVKKKICKGRVGIKPLSVNEAWQGRRFKSKKYKSFEKEMILTLPNLKINPESKLEIYLKYGFTSPLSDIDNPCKMVLDCLSKKYGFNDRNVFLLHQEKEIVKKGLSYIQFEIKELQY